VSLPALPSRFLSKSNDYGSANAPDRPCFSDHRLDKVRNVSIPQLVNRERNPETLTFTLKLTARGCGALPFVSYNRYKFLKYPTE
jgi:hypothetical protein